MAQTYDLTTASRIQLARAAMRVFLVPRNRVIQVIGRARQSSNIIEITMWEGPLRIAMARYCREVAHASGYGSLHMVGVLDALLDAGLDGAIRHDNGRMLWGEQGRPGYGLYDRALGATYLVGVFDALKRSNTRRDTA